MKTRPNRQDLRASKIRFGDLSNYIKVLFLVLFCCGLLSGCNASSDESSQDPVNIDPGTDIGNYTGPKALSGQLRELSEFEDVLDYSTLTRFIELEPNRDMRCPLPDDGAFRQIVEQLGGFRRPYRIPIEKDASTPRLYTGFESMLYYADAEGGSRNADVDIQRPDIVGRQGDIGFYLSDAYGLILVNIDTVDPDASTIGCTTLVPGRPNNFLIRGNTLITMVNSMNGLHSGLIQYIIEDGALIYHDSEFFENETILDARLFNDTLVVYTQEYEVSENNDSSALASGAAGAAIDASESYISFRAVKSHQLKVLDIFPGLNVAHTEVFLSEDRPVADSLDRYYSNFNSFLSASGEYLVVTESQIERIFQHYETRTYAVCTNYEEKSYTYCSTNWCRVPNPDYVPPNPSGIFNCQSDLLTCLRSIGPTVARYIRVPDGQTCEERTRSICTASEMKSWDYPVYTSEYYTRFRVFRFSDNQFVQLDDTLARVAGSDIEASEDPFRVQGHIVKHDHMKFNGDILYAISTRNGKRLNVFSIQGNAPIFVTDLDLSGLYASGSFDYTNASVNYTDDRIYISNSRYSGSWSDMRTINITDPLLPVVDNQVNIPTRLDQLLFADNALVGVGSTRLDIDDHYYTFGTFTRFSPLGDEVNSLILGTDYKYYSHSISYDDQVLNFDRQLQRIILPYTVSQPFDTEMAVVQNRLSMISLSNGMMSEEHTFTFGQRPERSLSVSDDLAFAFSDYFIHMLHRQDQWQNQQLFNGEIPASIYPSRAYPLAVKKYNQTNQYTFVLTDAESLDDEDAVDTLVVPKATSNYCTYERVYFDNDRILIVSEPPDVYFSYDDCAWDDTDLVIFTGYIITADGFEAWGDQAQMGALYAQIQKDIRCIIDIENMEGHEVYDFTQIPEEAICYTSEQYYDAQAYMR